MKKVIQDVSCQVHRDSVMRQLKEKVAALEARLGQLEARLGAENPLAAQALCQPQVAGLPFLGSQGLVSVELEQRAAMLGL